MPHEPPTLLTTLEAKANALPYVRDLSRPDYAQNPACGNRCPGCPTCGVVDPAYRDFWQTLVDQGIATCRIAPIPMETLMTITPNRAFSRAVTAGFQAWLSEERARVAAAKEES